ncbi:GFA family protein [Acuticoccus kandeliae]|uniref:GFA family protein n=1 Tax=Acuticoccus kandeliae TaxID=2073160 RepID=UPI000D3E93D2|nr:GFA family protein [Acuticoccus kandeliae]
MAEFAGGCACRRVRYVMETTPLFVHGCHCRWCQRETGSALVINAMIEADRVRLTSGEPHVVLTPSESGRGQRISRCPFCQIALWSNYAGSGERVRFVRVGTLDDPDRFPPDVHIYTRSKQPWLILPEGVPAFEEYYDRTALWPEESLRRREALYA